MTMINAQNATKMKTRDLHFDSRNPRLREFNLSPQAPPCSVIEVLWQTMNVRELVLSIAASGFFQHEPLIVVREKGKYVVIEGNRRLAAVRVMLDPDLARKLQANVPDMTAQALATLEELPVLQGTRQEAWRLLGFKHVNGPAKWSSYAKAQYIAHVHREYAVSLEDIARQMGDTHRTVHRLYRGLMIMEQAERRKVFCRANRFRGHFAFSHLYTGITYPGISSFLGLSATEEAKTDPVPPDKERELGELCRWLYGSQRDEIPPIIQSPNPDLHRLDAVLQSPEALSALRSGEALVAALEASRPATTVLPEAIMAAKRNLQQARAHLSTGYVRSVDLLHTAEDVLALAEDLYAGMRRKHRSERRQRLVEDP